MKYIAYCRKSTDETDRQILSIESQTSELQEFAERQNLEILDYMTEAKTAKVPGRPVFENLLKRIEKGEAQGIISWHPDRLARNSIDGGKIIYSLDMGKLVDLKFPSFWFENSPQGKFVLNIAFGQSKYYVDNLSENVRRGQRTLVKNGVLPHKPPFGYIYNETLKKHEVDLDNSKVVKKIFKNYADGVWGQSKIALYLSEFGYTKKNGEPVNLNNVVRMLTNKFYIGIFYFAGEWHEGSHPTFIDKNLFNKVQKQLKINTRDKFKTHNFPFLGLMKCGECGASITAEYHRKFFKGTNRLAEYYHYRCTKKLGVCHQKYLPQNEVENQLRKIVKDSAIPAAWIPEWEKKLEIREMLEKQKKEVDIKNLEAETKEIENKLNLLLDSYLEGVVDSGSYKQKKNELFEEKLKLQEKIESLHKGGVLWLERFREFLITSKNCGKIALRKNNSDELCSIGKNIGSNFFLKDRHLSFTPDLGFDTVYSCNQRPTPIRALDLYSRLERETQIILNSISRRSWHILTS